MAMFATVARPNDHKDSMRGCHDRMTARTSCWEGYGDNIEDVTNGRLINVTAMMIRQGVVVLKYNVNYFT